MIGPTFDQFVVFLREAQGIRTKIPITPATRLEKDLGITGDDGVDLLEETQKRFGVKLWSEEHGYKETFNLAPDEYMFHSEGFDMFWLIRRLLGRPDLVRELTAGGLHDAVCRASGSPCGSVPSQPAEASLPAGSGGSRLLNPQGLSPEPGETRNSTPMRHRKAFLALLASLGTPGLGQLYNGRLRKAALMYGLQCALPGIGSAFPPAESFAHLVILVLLLICIPLLVIVDAIRDARRSGEVPLHRYNRWYVYLAVLLVHGVVIGPAFVRFSGLPDLKAFKVHGTSMTPSLADGDRIVVDLAAYSRNHPKRGDVVVFTMPPDESKLYVKRVLGLPGERIELTEKGVLVNGTPLEDPWGHYADSGKTDMRRFSPVVVPEGSLFLLGDSRNDSHDSKFYGPVEESQVLGKARYLYWSKKTERIGKKLD